MPERHSSFRLLAESGTVLLTGLAWSGEPAAGEWGLLVRQIGICTGVNVGAVDMRIERLREAPSPVFDSSWEDAVVASAELDADAAARSASALPDDSQRLADASGLHAVAIAARGRDRHPDAAADVSGEVYLLRTWPLCDVLPASVLLMTSKRGQSLASGPEPVVPGPPPSSTPVDVLSGRALRPRRRHVPHE